MKLASLACILVAVPLVARAEPPKEIYWGTTSPAGTLVDVISLPEAESAGVASLIEEKMAGEVGPEGNYPVAPADPRLPRRFSVGQEFAVITTAGTCVARLRSFAVGTGASESHLYLILGGCQEGKGDALVVPRALVPGEATLRPAASENPAAAAVKRPLARARAQAAAVADKADKKLGQRVRRLKLGAKNTTFVKGRFGGAAAALVSIEVADVELQYFSALFFVDARGNVVSWVHEPELEITHYPIKYLVDLEGDGVDEVIFESTYYEGNYVGLLRWTGSKHVVETLTGDGA